MNKYSELILGILIIVFLFVFATYLILSSLNLFGIVSIDVFYYKYYIAMFELFLAVFILIFLYTSLFKTKDKR